MRNRTKSNWCFIENYPFVGALKQIKGVEIESL